MKNTWIIALIAALYLPAAALGQEKTNPEMGRAVEIRQDSGKTVYWVLPGPRRLSERLFGVPGHPLRTGERNRELATGAVRELFERFPIMAGVPLELRATNEDKTKFTETKKPTPVGDRGKIVSGRLEITYRDRQPMDLPGDPGDTRDGVDLAIGFTDPQGNEYGIEILKLYQPPFPGFESGGGVLTDTWIHGSTGTDSPLFPKVFTYGAFWGIGNIIINGKVVDRDKWVHVMTTQTVRDKNYRLAIDEELPLPPEETIAGQVHHTHVIVRPIKITPEGPVFEPVKTAFTLPNGKKQPFIHIMFEEDTIVHDAFKDWLPRAEARKKNIPKAITVKGAEWFFDPGEITVRKGEEVTIIFEHAGKVAHNFGIGEFGVRTATILSGQTDEITFTPTRTGRFPFWCSVPGHRDAGMQGTFIVTDGAAAEARTP